MKAIIRTIAIAILSGITLAFNSPVEITGVVKDDVGNALQGVKITVSPTGKVSYTDKNGQYKILFVETDKEMVFEMAGFKTVHIKPRGRTIININLKTEKIKEDLILHEEAELAADDKVRPGLPIRGSKKMHAVYSIAGGAGNQESGRGDW